MKQIPIKRFIPGIVWFILVLVLICLPQHNIPELNEWSVFLEKIYFDKWVHAGMFGMLAFLFIFPFGKSTIPSTTKWKYFIWISIIVSFWGLTTEIIQLIIPGRSFELLDWAADSFGALIALIISKKNILKN